MNTEIQPAPPKRFDEMIDESRTALETLMLPESVAIIGASETPGSVGRTLVSNFIASRFQGAFYPVNPKHRTVLDVTAYPAIGAIPRKIDLAVICTPAPTIPSIISECVEAGVKAAVIISAGFKETGKQGSALEQDILGRVKGTRMRIVGPNCLGIMVPRIGLNATFVNPIARPGSIAFLSQSGALGAAVLDWGMSHHVGFSTFVSLGSMLDVGWGDLLYSLGKDPNTKSILIYMETIGNARKFLSAAREVSLRKPIIVLKVGRTLEAAQAAVSHTGSLTGSDEVLDAAFRRAGVLRVQSISDFFDAAQFLEKQPLPKGPRLAIVTNAGGPAALSTDSLLLEGGSVASLSKETISKLDRILPNYWSHANPVDVLGDADTDRYIETTKILAADDKNDGVLVILTPQAMTQSGPTAQALVKLQMPPDKPLLTSWMGGKNVQAGREILTGGNVPMFPYPDRAAKTFASLWRYRQNLGDLYKTPFETGAVVGNGANRQIVRDIIFTARKAGRTLLTEVESKTILAAYCIPTVAAYIATNQAEAVKIAERMEGPFVVKLLSETITHKADAGGVKLNLQNAEEVRRAFREIESAVCRKYQDSDFLGVTVQRMIETDGYEVILGSSTDSQLGPVLLFGAGGHLVEVLKDRAVGLPPLNSTLALRLIEETNIAKVLKGLGGKKPIDLKTLEEVIVRFSHLVTEQRWIKEIDINPLIVSHGLTTALDARIILHPLEVGVRDLVPLAIRPYPEQYVTGHRLAGGTQIRIRPMRPEDEPAMVRFHQALSEATVRDRYFSVLKLEDRIAHERLSQICFNDYDCEIPLVVDCHNPEKGSEEILAVGRLDKARDKNEATFALVVSDQWQGLGIGTLLLQGLITTARREGLQKLSGPMAKSNGRMRNLCEKCGLEVRFDLWDGLSRAEMRL